MSVPCVDGFFNKICRILVSKLYGRYAHLMETEAEWGAKVTGIFEFPCVGSWNRFHVYVNSNVKNCFNFKKPYSMTKFELWKVGPPAGVFKPKCKIKTTIH